MKQLITLFASALVICSLTTSCNNKNEKATTSADSIKVVATSAIVYVNIDTIVVSYDMYKDMSAIFQEKQAKVEASVTSKGKSLEKDLVSYQEKAQKGLITRAQAQTLEEDLTKKQQEFMQFRDKEIAGLAEEEQVMLNQIHYSIVEFLKEFNSDKRYGMIISTNTSGPILNADPDLDITKVVLNGLNKNYAKTKTKK